MKLTFTLRFDLENQSYEQMELNSSQIPASLFSAHFWHVIYLDTPESRNNSNGTSQTTVDAATTLSTPRKRVYAVLRYWNVNLCHSRLMLNLCPLASRITYISSRDPLGLIRKKRNDDQNLLSQKNDVV